MIFLLVWPVLWITPLFQSVRPVLRFCPPSLIRTTPFFLKLQWPWLVIEKTYPTPPRFLCVYLITRIPKSSWLLFSLHSHSFHPLPFYVLFLSPSISIIYCRYILMILSLPAYSTFPFRKLSSTLPSVRSAILSSGSMSSSCRNAPLLSPLSPIKPL